ncbi:MAG: helix-turn-helix transcriptional regulator [Patescibacteria group bacterium]|nr:helix-turn-helix transcriptional regulator [Patescibacteria group bacterium]MBU2509077.1 helix-turn-helix transcriptional regulator [Patescibacteria group bacterium]
MTDQTIYNCLKELRRSKGMTQEALAKKVGTSRQTICSMEKGDYIPSLKLALLISKQFESSVEDLFHLKKRVCKS